MTSSSPAHSAPRAHGLLQTVLFSSALALTLPAHAAPPLADTSPRTAGGPSVTRPADVALSPDARFLAWTTHAEDGGELYLTDRARPGTRQTLSPAGKDCTSAAPVWSPDGRTLALLSNCTAAKSSQQQIFLYTPADRKTRQLTHLTGNLEQPAWSPDGRSIAFLFVENATRSAGALDAMKPPAGVIGEDGLEVQRIYAVDVASGLGSWVSPLPLLHVYEFDWAPDSLHVTYIAADAPGENTWWVAKLYTQTVGFIAACGPSPNVGYMCKEAGAPMGVPNAILDPATVSGPLHGLQLAVPRFSPDGKQIAFIGGLMSDQGATGGDLYTLPATGGIPKDLTPSRPATPVWFAWSGDHTLLVSEIAGGANHLFALNTDTLAEEPGHDLRYLGSLSAGGIEHRLSIARNGEIAAVRSAFSTPPEIWAGPVNALTQVTHLNDAVAHAAATLPRTDSVEWTNGSFHVQGWLHYPPNYDAHRRYPLLVQVHGGPSASIESTWRRRSDYTAAGYFVFEPNPRGSYGQGEAFVQANRKDFGYGDLSDILLGMDAVEKRVSIDRDREGLFGWSYGGFMTMFAVTQTHRFHAAVAGAGIANWQSYYGENSIDQWMKPFFGATVYDDPAVYARSSAIEFIKRATTPTLVIVGDRDGECPAPQSYEFWHALRAQHVKTQLVIYPNEGHRFKDPAHIADRTHRTLAWFAENMPESKIAKAN